jgi:hypothetical protein
MSELGIGGGATANGRTDFSGFTDIGETGDVGGSAGFGDSSDLGESAQRDDELVRAARAEEAEQVARRDRTRAWLVSITGSAAVILLAVGAVVLLTGPARRTPANAGHAVRLPIAVVLPTGSGNGADVVEVIAMLDAIRLPAGWSRLASIDGAVCAPSVECLLGLSGADGVTWSTAWVAPAGSPHAADDVTAALAAAGWRPCATPLPGDASCWQKASLRLTVSPAPGGRCRNGTPACPTFSVSVKVLKP